MPTNYGAISTGFNAESEALVRDVSPLFMLNPNEYALTSLLGMKGIEGFTKDGDPFGIKPSQLGMEIAERAKFEMQSSRPPEDVVYVNNAGGYASGDTSVVVDNGTIVSEKSVLFNPRTNEYLLCTAISTNTLTVTRGAANSTAAAILDSDELHILGVAKEVNAVSIEAITTEPDLTYNYTQIFEEAYGISRTHQGEKRYDVTDKYDYEKKMAYFRLMRRLTKAMWFGKRYEDTSNERRFMGGILSFIDNDNVMDAGGNLTAGDLDIWLRDHLLKYNANEKYVFGGSKFVARIDEIVNEKAIRTMKADETILGKFGLVVKEYQSRYGVIKIVREPVFDKFQQGTIPYSSYAVGLDLDAIKLKFLSNGKLMSYDDIQENDRDGRKGHWLTEVGVKVDGGLNHAILKNL